MNLILRDELFFCFLMVDGKKLNIEQKIFFSQYSTAFFYLFSDVNDLKKFEDYLEENDIQYIKKKKKIKSGKIYENMTYNKDNFFLYILLSDILNINDNYIKISTDYSKIKNIIRRRRRENKKSYTISINVEKFLEEKILLHYKNQKKNFEINYY